MGDDAADREDARRVLAGDVDAFGGIVARWQRPLVSLAWRFCHDHGRAEDMAQEAFVRVFRNLGRWRGEGAFSTWLFAVAVNVYRSLLRRHPASLEVPEREPDGADPRDPGQETSTRDGEIRRAVDALPVRYREAVLLYYFQEMDVGRAAACLRVPPGTLKARLHRARGLLRERIEGRPAAGRDGEDR
jgi:RNA polymerase sigma-70 factor (ECF subfamily)